MNKFLFPLFFFLLLSYNSFSQDSIQKMVPTEVLFKKSNQYNFSISPDGKYFLETLETEFNSDIIIVDIDNFQMLNKITLGKRSVEKVHWLTSNRILFESEGEIYAIDIDGSNSMKIIGRMSGYAQNWWDQYKKMRINTLISMLPNNKFHVLLENYDYKLYASLEKVNIFTGKKFTVLSGKRYKINKWITDINGEVKLALRIDENGLEFFKFNFEEKKLTPFRVNIGGTFYSIKLEAQSYLNQNLTLEGFGFDPDIIYLTSNIGTDKRKLISYNIKEDKIVETVLEDVNCDVKDIDGEDISYVIDKKKNEIAGIKYTGIIPQYKWFSESISNIHNSINEKYPTFFNEIIDSDHENKRFLIHQWSDNKSGNVGVYDKVDSTYSVMFHFNKELQKYNLSKTKNVVIKTRDDYKLPAYINFPINYNKEDEFPLVVIPHGGPWSRDYWGLDWYAQYFATRGYVVLRVNFRGSSGFGKKHIKEGMSSIDEIMINDIADATKYVINNKSISKDKVFIFGHSYGGYATYMELLKYPDIFAAGVAIAAPSDIKEWMKVKKKEKSYFAYEVWESALGTKDSKFLNKISPINLVQDLNKPLLIFHGRNDQKVSVEQSESIMKELEKYQKDAKLEILEKEGHSIRDSNTLGYVLDVSETFFKEHKMESDNE